MEIEEGVGRIRYANTRGSPGLAELSRVTP